jgi:hypothetical protein
MKRNSILIALIVEISGSLGVKKLVITERACILQGNQKETSTPAREGTQLILCRAGNQLNNE